MTVELENESAARELDRWVKAMLAEPAPAGPDALRNLVTAIGRSPWLWGEELALNASDKGYQVLWASPEVEIALFCWAGGQQTTYHDHGGASGAMSVCTGALVESAIEAREGRLLRERAVVRRAGSSFGFGPEHIHRLRHHRAYGVALSVHAYGPPTGPQSDYEVLGDGRVRALNPSP